VVADLVAIARGGGHAAPVFAMPVASLTTLPAADPALRHGRYYLRLDVADRPGVLAELTAALRDHGVSIESLIQRGEPAGDDAMVVMVTHVTGEAQLVAALAQMAASDAVSGTPVMMHILDF
jgi:homoserine dehydrogenase